MAYIEKKGKYSTFVKKFSFFGRQHRISRYIGKADITAKEYLLKNFDKITDEEFSIRKNFLKDLKLSYNKDILKEIELLAIKINDSIEIKEIKNYVMRAFAVEFIYNSNNIEGSNIPAQKVKELLEKGKSKYGNKNEIKEVLNSLKALEYLKKDFKYNLASIKRVHHILTKDLIMQNGERYPKGFKKIPITVNNNPTSPPGRVDKELGDLIKWVRKNKAKIHPLILAFRFHLVFERIHPFRDANGRTGRLLLNKILMDSGYFPMIVYKENKAKYSNSIGKSSEREKPYYDFMAKQMRKSYKKFYGFVRDL